MSYNYDGHTVADINKYPYYPYVPTGGRAPDKNERILAGVRLVPV